LRRYAHRMAGCRDGHGVEHRAAHRAVAAVKPADGAGGVVRSGRTRRCDALAAVPPHHPAIPHAQSSRAWADVRVLVFHQFRVPRACDRSGPRHFYQRARDRGLSRSLCEFPGRIQLRDWLGHGPRHGRIRDRLSAPRRPASARGKPVSAQHEIESPWRVPSPFSLVAAALLAFLTLLLLISPAVFILIGSFRPGGGLISEGGGFTVDNYIKIFRSGFGRFVVNSLVICVAATLVSTVLSIMAAYAFSRFSFRLKRPLFLSILFGQVFPWIVLINPLFVAFATVQLTNSYIGMILTYTAFTIPFSVYMLVGYLVTVPKSLDEA